MARREPIDTAPKDGTKVMVVWRDRRGVENHSIAHYRNIGLLNGVAGEWDAADNGWWTFVDDDTQKRIHPEAWFPEND